ncbi:MAG: transcriptional regulator [Ignavibacteriae bacterium]|nr:transcriptional regulator [Ignavibacteriota bacterium]
MFESRVRLGIMATLMVNDELDFNAMKQTLDITDGNLASHAAALESEGYLKISKTFVGKKTQTTYSATTAGRRAFTQHLDALEKLIKQSQ